MLILKIVYLLFFSSLQCSASDWSKLEVRRFGVKVPTYTLYKEKNITKLEFQGRKLKIPVGLASNLNAKVSQINYFFNRKEIVPKLREKKVNGTCEIIDSFEEIYLYQTINNKKQKILIYKQGNCAFKGKEYYPKDSNVLSNVNVVLNLLKTASNYNGFCK